MTDLASDVVIKVGEMSFHLHKVLSVFSLSSIISIIYSQKKNNLNNYGIVFPFSIWVLSYSEINEQDI